MKRPKKSKLPPRYISREKLPKKLGGADVIRALPMHHAKCDRLVEKKALDQFDAKTDLYLVVNESALEGLYPDTRAFRDKKDAIRYARALGNGNVDHRVLRVTEQTLVVATENDL